MLRRLHRHRAAERSATREPARARPRRRLAHRHERVAPPPEATCPACHPACPCEGWRHRAQHDTLTGLPNRAQLETELARALARATRHAQRLAVLFLDLDGFKAVNDGQGHAAGDRLIRSVGARLRDTLRAEDLLARYGGDEFVAVIEAPRQPGDAAVAAAALLAAVKDAAADPGSTASGVTVSIGIALYPEHAADVAGLLGRADAAMYRAKRAGGNGVAFADAPALRQAQDTPLP